MRRVDWVKALGRWALVGAAGVGCAACGGSGRDPGDTLANLAAFNSFAPPPPPEQRQTAAVDINCPVVQIAEGQAASRVYAGADQSPANVRYQFSFGDIARECALVGTDQIGVRLGVAGYIQQGPAGAPASFTVPVKVTIVRGGDLRPVATKTYRIGAQIPQGQASGAFSIVTEPILVPFTRADADADYSIFVSFDQGGAARPEKPARRRRPA